MKPSKKILASLLLVIATFAAYLPAIKDGGYIWDDDHYVTENGVLHREDGFARIWFDLYTTPQYYPLVFSTFKIEYHLNLALERDGRDPFIFHFDNVLIHALSALLLWRLLVRLKVPGALLAAGIFALHPVHVESVAWITERKNTLSALFYLTSLHCYLNWTDLVTGVTRRRRWYGLALLAFFFALTSKTVTSTLGPVILLLIWWQRGRLVARDFIRTTPFFVMGLIGAFVTSMVEHNHVEAKGWEWDLSIAERVIIAGRAIVFYFEKLIWPHPLVFNYERWTIDTGSLLQWAAPVGVLSAMALLVALALLGKIARWPATALLFFAGTLFPALGFINVYPMRYSFVADHFQYLASLGVIIPLAAIAARRLPRTVFLGFSGLVLAILAVLTWKQCGIYEGEESLWKDTLNKNPKAWMAENNLGMFYSRQGDKALYEVHTRRAAELNPRAREVLNNIGLLESTRLNFEEALRWFDRALEADPRHQPSLANKGLTLMYMNRDEEALVCADRALAIAFERNTDYYYGRLIRGQILHKLGRDQDALKDIEICLKSDWTNALAHAERGRILRALKRDQEARACFENAVKFDPRYTPALEELAQLATAAKDDEKAARYVAQALAVARPELINSLGNKAVSLAFTAIMKRTAEDGARLAFELATLAGPAHAPRLLAVVLDTMKRLNRREHFNALLTALRQSPTTRQVEAIQKAIAGLQPL